MAPRSPRSSRSRPKAGRQIGRQAKPNARGPRQFEDIAARAARLGITPERVLIEYARIAFADLRHIVEIKDDQITIKPPNLWTEADAAAVSEIVFGSDPSRPRVKLYSKKAALDAIARHLGMFPAPPRPPAPEAPEEDEGEDPREFLARQLARLAAGAGQE